MDDLALIIGRFQPFHKGHKLLVDTALSQCKSVLILIGSSNTTNTENPYSFSLRKEIIETEFSEEQIFIGALPDFENDEDWMKYIISYIPNTVSSIKLYCGDKKNDSAIKTLIKHKDMIHSDYEIVEIPRSIIPISASKVREIILKEEYSKLEEYLLPSTIAKIS